MYFKLLPENGCVKNSDTLIKLRGVDSVSASNIYVKKFPSALAIAVYCLNQKDDCEPLNASRPIYPPPLLGLVINVGFSDKVISQIKEQRGRLLHVQSLSLVHDSNSSFLQHCHRRTATPTNVAKVAI